MKYKYAIIAAAIVFVVILTLLFLNSRENGGPLGPNVPSPTPSIFISENATNPTEVKLETIMQTQLPMQTPSVDIAYSRLIKKFYIFKKKPNADEIIKDFFESNDLEGTISEDKIVYTNRAALQVLLDDERRQFPNHPDTRQLDY